MDAVVASLTEWAEAGGGVPPEAFEAPAPARCAIATALADLEARRLEVPLYRLLGGSDQVGEVRCNATLGADSAREVADEAERLAEEGFTRFKLKVGLSGEVESFEALRKAIEGRGSIRLDANGAWTPEQARAFVSGVGAEGIELLEQPGPDLSALADVRRTTGLTVVADESVATPGEAARAREMEACDAVTIKISKVGGLDGSLGGHLPTYLSSALDGPVGLAAAGHLASTLPGEGPTGPVFHGLATARLFDGTIATVETTMEGDRLILPEGPGTGVELDESALARFRL